MKQIVENYEKYDSELWIGKPRKGKSKKYRRCQIYTNIKNYNKLWIKTPFMLLPYKVSIINILGDKKIYSLTATLNPLTSERKKFIALIKKIDNEIIDKVGSCLNDEYTYCSSINESGKGFFKHKINMFLPKNEDGSNNFLLYDKNKETKTIDDIIPNTKMIGIIELFDVWIDDEKKTYHASWNMAHCKLFQNVLIDENYFVDLKDDSEVNLNKNLGSSKEKYKIKCPNCEHKVEITININIQGIIDSQKQNYQPIYGATALPYRGAQPFSFYGAPSAPSAPSFDSGGAPPAPPMGPACGPAMNHPPFVPNRDDILNAMKKLKKTVPNVKDGKKENSSIKKSTTGKKKVKDQS